MDVNGNGIADDLAGDFDGDGRDDLLSTAYSDPTATGGVIRGLFGVIRLGEPGPALVTVGEHGGYSIGGKALPGDLDGDGVEDIVTSAGGAVLWFRGRADGVGFDGPVVLGLAYSITLVANLDDDLADEVLVVRGPGLGYGLIDSLGGGVFAPLMPLVLPWAVSYTHLTLPTTPYV